MSICLPKSYTLQQTTFCSDVCRLTTKSPWLQYLQLSLMFRHHCLLSLQVLNSPCFPFSVTLSLGLVFDLVVPIPSHPHCKQCSSVTAVSNFSHIIFSSASCFHCLKDFRFLLYLWSIAFLWVQYLFLLDLFLSVYFHAILHVTLLCSLWYLSKMICTSNTGVSLSFEVGRWSYQWIILKTKPML